MNKPIKVLIAHDGSPQADAAVEDLPRAGLPTEAEALVMSVAELWLPPPSSFAIAGGTVAATPSERGEAAAALARRVARRVREEFPGWETREQSAVGSPAGEIIRQAEEWDADLIVVGPHGLSALQRVLLGSVSQKVVHDAPCSVRVARASAKQKDAPVRIVIGDDGSPDAQAAVREVAARAWPANSEVRVVTAVGPLYPVRGDGDKVVRTRARAMQQSAEVHLGKAGLSVSSVIEELDPRRLLVREAETWKADAIFVGTSGMGRIGRLVLGSVASAVAARAHCSVEVVRPKETA